MSDLYKLIFYFKNNNVKLSQMTLLLPDLDQYGKNTTMLGEGTFGKVFLTDKDFAIKEIPINEEYGIESTELREIAIIDYLNRPNKIPFIIYFDAVSIDKDKVYMAMPKATSDLYHYIKKNTLILEQRKKIMFQLLQGVAYMHSKNVLHRDLKTKNILLIDDLNIKIADFGLARLGYNSETVIEIDLFNTLEDNIVTQAYRSPEVILYDKNYSFEIDMWSVGVIFFELFVKYYKLPFENEILAKVIENIIKYIGKPTNEQDLNQYSNKRVGYLFTNELFEQYSDQQASKKLLYDYIYKINNSITNEEFDLLTKLLTWKSNRLTAKQALEHPYFKDMKLENIDNILIEKRIKRNKKITPKYINGVMSIDNNITIDILQKFNNAWEMIYYHRTLFYLYIGMIDLINNLNDIYTVCCIISMKLFMNFDNFDEYYKELINLKQINNTTNLIKIENNIYKTLNFELIFPTLFTKIKNTINFSKFPNEILKDLINNYDIFVENDIDGLFKIFVDKCKEKKITLNFK